MPDDVDPPPPASLTSYDHVRGPFLHGTAALFEPGDLVEVGRRSHFRPNQPLAHVYFTTREETAAWGAELASALRVDGSLGRVYEVEPTGPFEDDPNVTDKRFPGNPTRSYRSREPLRVVREVAWTPHPPEQLQAMLSSLDRLRAEGKDVIED